MKKIVMMLVMAMMVVEVFALTERVGNITWTYTIENGEAAVCGGVNEQYSSSVGAIVVTYYPSIPNTTAGKIAVPEILGGCPVTAISDYTFYGCSALTGVTIPNTVRSIGTYAFCSCSGLSSIEIPMGVESISAAAFYKCSSLASVSLPKSLCSLAGGAFSGTALYNNAADGIVLIDGCAVGIKGTCAGNVVIPEGCRLVAASLFGTPSGSWYSYNDAINVTSITLPESLEVICHQAFCRCSISSIRIPSGVSRVIGNPFCNCNDLKTIDIAPGNPYYKVVNGLLMDKDGMTVVCCPATKASVTIPAGVTEIGDYAFYYCNQLRAVALPSGVRRIGDYAFYYCKELDSIELPDGLLSIGNSAYLYCSKVPSVTMPNSVKTVGSSVFGALSSSVECALKIVNMPGEITVGKNVFTNCPSLKVIHITNESDAKSAKQVFIAGGNAVDGIEFWAGEFESENLRFGVNAEDELVVLGLSAQQHDGQVQIPSRIGDRPVTKVLPDAFKGEISITAVTVPDSIMDIAKNAFEGCKNIETVYWDNNNTWADEILVPLDDQTLAGGMTSPDGRVSYTVSSEKSILFAIDNLSQFVFMASDSYYTHPYCYIDGQGSSLAGYSGGKYVVSRISVSDHVMEVSARDSSGYGSYSQTIKVTKESLFSEWFKDARSLSVVVGPHVSRLPAGVFANWKNLYSVTIPKGVDAIGATTFYGCSALNELVVSPENTTYKSVDGSLFSADGKVLVWAKGGTLVSLPDGVETIGRCAFAGKENLRAVVIPSTVKTIEAYAFYGCHAFSRLDMPVGVTKLGRKSFPALGEVSFFADPPTGFSESGLVGSRTILIPRKYAGAWKSYVTANNYAIRRGPTAVILSSKIRESDPTIMDVEYMVTSESPTVKVRALAFKNGVRSFANVVRPETFVDGTAVNIGDAIEANVPHKLSWRVSADYGIELTKMKFEVIAQEGDLLPMEWIYIPKSEQYGKMKVSYNTLSEAQVFDALMWLYAAKDPGLTLSGGTLRGGGYTLASGATSNGSSAFNYVFSKMGWSVLSGAIRSYAISETRKTLPSISAYQIVE